MKSGDNLISNLPIKFYSGKITETNKIVFRTKLRELDKFIK